MAGISRNGGRGMRGVGSTRGGQREPAADEDVRGGDRQQQNRGWRVG